MIRLFVDVLRKTPSLLWNAGMRHALTEAIEREQAETQARTLGLTDTQIRGEIDWRVTRYRERGLAVNWTEIRCALIDCANDRAIARAAIRANQRGERS